MRALEKDPRLLCKPSPKYLNLLHPDCSLRDIKAQTGISSREFNKIIAEYGLERENNGGRKKKAD